MYSSAGVHVTTRLEPHLELCPPAVLPLLPKTHPPVAFRCSMSSAADDKNADMMLKLSLNQMESVKGLEGLPEKDANKAISAVKMAAGGEVAEKERKLLNSRRLHEIFIARRDERNEKLAFDTMFNSLQVHQFCRCSFFNFFTSIRF